METDWEKLRDMLSEDSDISQQREALITIKNAVIGSNRQKGELIAHALVPAILKIGSNDTVNSNLQDRLNAFIIMGSLAKGNDKQVQMLITKYNILPVLTREIFLKHNEKDLVEVCLSTMRSLYEHDDIPVEEKFTDTSSLIYFLGLASAENSFKTQICVASILVSICKTVDDQIRLLHAGTLHVLARLICSTNPQVQLSALHCLAAMCHQNRSVADNVCVTSHHGCSMPDILTILMSRMLIVEIQLSAARCLTFIYRSGTLLAADSRILNKTLPSLARLCSDDFDPPTRGEAAETLAYLIEIDLVLQRTAAISNSLLKSLYQLVRFHPAPSIQAALRCYASLAANDEAIRKRIMEANEGRLIEAVLNGLEHCDLEVRLASVRCLHSFSRSVQQLRTTFQDHRVWQPLMGMMDNQSSIELLIVVTSTICNLLLEFSPSKELLLNAGIIKEICSLTDHKVPALRVNSVWALMNMSFQADQRVRTDILNTLGTNHLIQLLYDTDANVVLKGLGLLRNLLRYSYHVDYILTTHSEELLNALHMILESSHSANIKEQALCVVGNVASEANSGDYIIHHEGIMSHLGSFLFQSDEKLCTGAAFALHNIVHRKDFPTDKKLNRLKGIDTSKIIKESMRRATSINKRFTTYMDRTMSQIARQLKKFDFKD